MKMYRQGDVLLRRIKTVPKDAEKQKVTSRIVLAYGEVTGHAHAIQDFDAVDVFVKADGTMYLSIKEETALVHEEHSTIVLSPGKYERVIQREYSPEEIRNVRD